jgi:dTMP kinase
MERKPLFITFEGGEGCGKSTQSKFFSRWFCENYGEAVLTREPGGVPSAEQIRNTVLTNEFNLDSLTELFLFQAARHEFTSQFLLPHLKSGKSVISDRFFDSTSVYQGYAGEIDLHFIKHLNYISSGGLSPDLTFILDVDPVIGKQNVESRGELNRIDKKSIEFHEKVRQGYLDIARQEPNRCILIPYQNGVKNVQEKIIKKFSDKYLNP